MIVRGLGLNGGRSSISGEQMRSPTQFSSQNSVETNLWNGLDIGNTITMEGTANAEISENLTQATAMTPCFYLPSDSLTAEVTSHIEIMDNVLTTDILYALNNLHLDYLIVEDIYMVEDPFCFLLPTEGPSETHFGPNFNHSSHQAPHRSQYSIQ